MLASSNGLPVCVGHGDDEQDKHEGVHPAEDEELQDTVIDQYPDARYHCPLMVLRGETGNNKPQGNGVATGWRLMRREHEPRKRLTGTPACLFAGVRDR